MVPVTAIDQIIVVIPNSQTYAPKWIARTNIWNEFIP